MKFLPVCIPVILILMLGACAEEEPANGTAPGLPGRVYVSLEVSQEAIDFITVTNATANGIDLSPWLDTKGAGTTNYFPITLTARSFPASFAAELRSADGTLVTATNVSTIVGDPSNTTPYNLTNYNYIWKISISVGYDPTLGAPIIMYTLPDTPQQRVIPVTNDKSARQTRAENGNWINVEYVKITNTIPVISLNKVTINGFDKTANINGDWFSTSCGGDNPKVGHTIAYNGFWGNNSYAITGAIGGIIIGGGDETEPTYPLSDLYYSVVFRPYYDMNNLIGKARVDIIRTEVLAQ